MTFDKWIECCKHLPVSYDYQYRLNRRLQEIDYDN